MFVSKLFNQMRLSGNWRCAYIKKHKITKARRKVEKKLGRCASDDYGNAFAFSILNRRYSKFLKSIVDPSLDKSFSATAEKIVWWMWLQGEENAPDICKAGFASIKKYLPDYKVVVLINDNIFDYVHVSDNIKSKYQKRNLWKN